jgi:lysophospholipase L1-like esterase
VDQESISRKQGPNSARQRNRRANLLLLTAAVAVSFAFAEIILRIFMERPPGRRDPQVRYDPHPVRRFTLRPDQETFTYESPANVDYRGFRTNGPAQGVPRSGITILALGDSFTFGLGVPDDATWPARLEQFLSKTISPGPQVLNIGTVSYGVYQEMDLLKEKGLAEIPSVIVHALYWNDYMSARPPAKGDPPLLTVDGYFTWDQEKRPAGAFRLAGRAIAGASVLAYTLKSVGQVLLTQGGDSRSSYGVAYEKLVHGEIDPDEWQPVMQFYEELRRLGRERNFIPFVVILPVSDIVSNDFSVDHPYPRFARKMLESVGLPYLDGFAVWKSKGLGRSTFLRQGRDAHLNVSGYEILARALTEALMNNPDIVKKLRDTPVTSPP